MNKNKFNQLNVITIIAMFMIFNIHFFNYFSGEISPNYDIVVHFLRGISIIAVNLFLMNSAYTSIHLGKKTNYRTIFLFLIIPTLLFQQLNYYMFGGNPAMFDFTVGFVGSWYGEMYIGVLLLLPLVIKIQKKKKHLVFIVSLLLVFLSWEYSIINHTATNQALGLKMALSYVALVYVSYYLNFVTLRNLANKYLIIGLIIPLISLEIFAYSGIFNNKYIIISYFSPITILYTVLIFKLILSLDVKKLNYRVISRTSYFFYFSHYIIIHTYENYMYIFISNYIILAYIIGIIASYLLAYILYNTYDFIINRVLDL